MRALLAGLALLLGSGAAAGGGPWPEGLEAPASSYRQTLNAAEALIRAGTLAQPRGIEEALQFDKETHGCHRGPAHAYREYGEPEPPSLPKSKKGSAKVERVTVRYPYRVFYRQAMTLEALFEKPWKEGNEGAVEVEFRSTPRGWEPGLKRELLGDPTKAARPGAGPGRGGEGREDVQPKGGGVR